MDVFDLARLTDHDFELVCKDILETLLGQRLEVFAPGRDGGIDLRHLAPAGRSSTIVQCKHWAGSGQAKLLSHYKATEARKVHALAPDRYIVATSVRMNPAGKATMVELLSPHLRIDGDILGSDELIAELRNNPMIVKRHLRLWLTSAAVLDALLTKEIHVRTNFLEFEIADTLKTYAPTPAFDEASQVLEDNHVLVISGIPGVGKTTLARVIAAAHRADGYDVYEIGNNIDDALRVWDDDLPQFFCYDDFLGQTSFRDTAATSEDARLIQLMTRVSRSHNKRLVLTTREYILAQARRESEKLDGSHDLQLARFVIDIRRYTLAARAEILYNHLYFSRLPHALVAPFADPVVYEPIIRHRNFNPRLVAITLENLTRNAAEPQDAIALLMANLESPEALWAHMFDNQMSGAEVGLVLTIYTFRTALPVDSLIEIWAGVKGLSLSEASRTVQRSLRTLEGTLIRILPSPTARVALHNPSIRDFLRKRLSTKRLLVRGVLQDAREFEQIATLFSVASGFDGHQLMGHIHHERAVLEHAVLRILPSELKKLNEGRWLSALTEAITIALAVQSDAIVKCCVDALEGSWPDYAESASDGVGLIEALRSAPGGSALRLHEEQATQWLIDDLLGNTSDWDALQVSAAALDKLGGPAARAALDLVNDRRLDFAQNAAASYLEYDQMPDLSEAQEMLDYLSEFGSAEQEFPGYSEFRESVEYRAERQRENQKENGTAISVTSERPSASIADMMAHLQAPSREE